MGLAAAIDTTAEKVVDTSAFGAAAATGTDSASTKQAPLPETPMLGVVTLSPDRRTLYAASPDGVAAIDAASLELRGRYLAGTTVSSVAISADGSRLYAATSGAIAVVEPTSGELIGELTETKQPYGIVALSPGA